MISTSLSLRHILAVVNLGGLFNPLSRLQNVNDRLHKRPALVAAVLVMAGIALHTSIAVSPKMQLLFLVAALYGAIVSANRGGLQNVFLAVAALTIGVIAGALSRSQFRGDDVALFTSDEPRLACLDLRLDKDLRLIEDPGQRHLPARQAGAASVVAVKTWRGWRPASGEIIVSISHAEPRLSAGQTVRVVGMLQRPAPAMNPGEFDWESYYRRQRILSSIRVNHVCDVRVRSAGVAPTLAEARLGVREWLALGFSPTRQADRALLQALMLGDRGPEIRGIERQFQKTGTSHLLSSSGLRMAVLGTIIYFICRLARVRPLAAAAAVTIGVVVWGYLTLPSPQALRPVIVAAALGLGIAGRRNVDSIQLLAIAAVVILVVHPLDLYAPGFQFSFIIVLGMLSLTSAFVAFLDQSLDPHITALEKIGRLSDAQRARRWLARLTIRVVAAACIAWMMSVPLVAYHFEQFTPWAVLIGVVLSPVVFAALGAGFFKLILTILFPSMAPTWAAVVMAPTALLRVAISFFSRLPAADIPITAPPVWAIVAFYGLLCLPLIPVAGRAVRWGVRCAPLGACALLMLLPGLLGFARQSGSGGLLRITLLSIGAGQCAVVEIPGKGAIMLDAGSSTIGDPLHECIEPFLHHRGRAGLDSIYLSHGDFDHISAAAGAWDECGLKEIVTTPYLRGHSAESVPCRRLVEMLDRVGHPPREVIGGEKFDWGGGAIGQVLWPPAHADLNSNNAGMVLRVIYGGRSILFPADIQDPAMRELLKNPALLKSDILVAAHHGSSEALTAEFVRAVDPLAIVSSNATRLTKKQRDFEKLIEHRPLYRTGRCGAIEIDLQREGNISVKPFLDRKQNGITIERDGRILEAK
ncbi:MAG TPA: ComEC/Rec2 family competence protein [Tepidisphaeraceae bacterium]|jgi:competence protein ComEC|nr:ComEC/Rec2 family competence protein [Tepidisphaeraceae bacterium]